MIHATYCFLDTHHTYLRPRIENVMIGKSAWLRMTISPFGKPELMAFCTNKLSNVHLFLLSRVYALLPHHISSLCTCGQSVLSLSDSLITSCIHIPSHLKNSCSFVFPYILQMQVLIIFTDGFLIDLNTCHGSHCFFFQAQPVEQSL